MKQFGYLLLSIFSLALQGQQIKMYFPHFAGKSYDFVIFQGDQQETIYQGVIPADGKFTLSVPDTYNNYKGMSRWLITGTSEGGGLDMFIPGHDFSVSCIEEQPNENNIIYTNNTGNKELNDLYKRQEGILLRHGVMLEATRIFSKADKNYPVFQKELQNQVLAYNSFQKGLKKEPNYISQFIQIVNITRGIGTKLFSVEKDKALNISDYITNDLDWNALYTSGHWTSIIDAWVNINTLVLKDPDFFAIGFKKIGNKIESPNMYSDFVGRTAYYLKQNKNENINFIKIITPIVKSSGKILTYDGSLSTFNEAGSE
ncbi:alkyl hydroperoxide reductase [Elizabethkingia anophelis]|uniref:alkyl hydroperoxide reductase n=1 Tax=Elizabethkingia anophelis TaxID=1117645 RepID=UPI003208FC5F